VAVGTEVPPWAMDFSHIFNRESFESLLERRVWDHAIELIPDVMNDVLRTKPKQHTYHPNTTQVFPE
jgi:hypothetical protein